MRSKRGERITVFIIINKQKGEMAQETINILISIGLIKLHRHAHRVAQRLGIINPRRTVISYFEQIHRRARLIGDCQECHTRIRNKPRLRGV